MVQYFPVQVHLTERSGGSLLRSRITALKHKDHTGGALSAGQTAQTAYLMKSQINKLRAAAERGQGVKLQFSEKQAAYHGMKADKLNGDTGDQTGAGWWSRLWRKIKNAGKFVYNKVLKPAYTKVIQPVASAVYNTPGIKQFVDSSINDAAYLVGQAANTFVPGTGNTITGAINRAGNSVIKNVTNGSQMGNNAPAAAPAPAGGRVGHGRKFVPVSISMAAVAPAKKPRGRAAAKKPMKGGRIAPYI